MLQTKFLSADDYHIEKLQHLVPHRIASIQLKQFHAFICSAWASRISSHTEWAEPSRANLHALGQNVQWHIKQMSHIWIAFEWLKLHSNSITRKIWIDFLPLQCIGIEPKFQNKKNIFMSSLFRKMCGKLEFIERCQIYGSQILNKCLRTALFTKNMEIMDILRCIVTIHNEFDQRIGKIVKNNINWKRYPTNN